MPSIYLENENLLIHPFRPDDLQRYDELVSEVFAILSDEDTLKYIPEKRLLSISHAENWLQGTIINFHSGRNRVHFITSKKNGRLIGLIDIIPPAVAREYYTLSRYPFFIEFYLKGSAKGKAVMTNLLPLVIAYLKAEGIENVAAVVNRRNYAASKVLRRSGFIFQSGFDPNQDLYAMTLLSEKPAA
ncbi:GNAT family N-acetyltransferase [Mucilaginibacter sp. cycad4]|uniref:GNAT family N-acetyltransferase n=1 Tax=Mucilaginibacter sp. cycad4 TaxID=3342096 RepID=UPI002AAAE5A4|nr:GNAT family N-acetyltransferase [Mucilaginibacter gossypii]WPU99046.1 GNAT family N-acetyltransferase [Mucilaginibacter gossypii]